MKRREFLGTGLAAGAAAVGAFGAVPSAAAQAGPRFRLNYAPHFGMFRHHAGHDPVDQIRFLADEGFTALEDSGLMRRPAAVQERIGRELDRRGMTMGLFVATADFAHPTFAAGDRTLRDRILRDLRAATTAARRVNARWCAIVPGRCDDRLPTSLQRSNAVDLLRRCAESADAAGLTLLLEPVHHDLAGSRMFLRAISQAVALSRAVGRPSCRVLFDVYHCHLSGRDPIVGLNQWWDQIGYVQLADAPGRKEPGTGRANCRGILRSLLDHGYSGPVGLEHGNSQPGKPGERAVLAAYEAHDPKGHR